MLDPLKRLIELAGAKPRVLVAFSGGVDSTVLAYRLGRQRRQLGALRLIHIDHGLQPDSAKWSRECARLAREWGLPLLTRRAKIERKAGESPEAVAREARYKLLDAAMKPGEVLVTAQHRDDQAETLLLQLLRGAGVAGLAAMPAFAPFGRGFIARPLLAVPRADIEAEAHQAQLRWIEDPSNANTRYSRNFLRHRLMPLIREHWPGADAALTRTAGHMAEAAALLQEHAARDLATLADGAGLSVTALRRLPTAQRRNALRAFFARAGVDMPEATRLREMSGALLSARADAQPEVRWGRARLQRRGGRLELSIRGNLLREIIEKSWHWADEPRLVLGDGQGFLELRADKSGPIDLDRLPAVLIVRGRQGGERLRPSTTARTQALKTLLQSAKVPVEDRAHMPLLFADGRLVAAGDRWIDASIAANVKSRRRARLLWTHSR